MAETFNTTTVPVAANTLETAGPVQESTIVALPGKTDSALVSSPPAPAAATPVEAPASAEPLTAATATTPKSKPARRGGSKHHTKLKACRRELAGIQAEIDSIHATIAALAVQTKQPEPGLLAQLASLQARKAENALTADAAFKEYEAASKAASERRQRLASKTATISSTFTPSADLGPASPSSSVSVTICTAPAVPLPPQTQTQTHIHPEVTLKPSPTASANKTLTYSAPIIRAPAWARLPSKKSAAIPIRAPGSAPLTVSPTPSYEDREDGKQDGSCSSDANQSSSSPTSSFAPTLPWTTDFVSKPHSETSKNSDAASDAASSSKSSSKSKMSSKSLKSSKSSSKPAQQTPSKAKTSAATAPATPKTAAVIPANSTASAKVKTSSKTAVPALTPSKATTVSTKSSAATTPVPRSRSATTSTPASAMLTATKKTRSVTSKASTTTHGQTTPSKTITSTAANGSTKDKAIDPSLTCSRCLCSLSKSPKDDYFSRSLQEKYLPVYSNSSDSEPMQTGGNSEHLFEPVFPADVSSSFASIAVVNLPIPPLEVSTMPPTDSCLFDDESTTPVIMIRLPGGPPSKPAGVPAVSASLTDAAKKPKRARRSKKRKQAATATTAAAASDAGSAHFGPITNASGDIVIDCDPPVLDSDLPVSCIKAASTSSKPSNARSRRAVLRQRKYAAAAAQAELALAAAVSLPESAASSPIISASTHIASLPTDESITPFELTAPRQASAVASSVLAPVIETASDQTILGANLAATAATAPLPGPPAPSPVSASSGPVKSVSANPLIALSRSAPTHPRASRIPEPSQRIRSASLGTKAPTTRVSSPFSRSVLPASKSYISLATARSPPISHAILPAKKSLRSPSVSSTRSQIAPASRPGSPASLRAPSRSSSRSDSRSASRSAPKSAMMSRSTSGTSIAGPRSNFASAIVAPTPTRPRATSRVSSLEAAGIQISKSKPASSTRATSRSPAPPRARLNPGASSFDPRASSFAPGTRPSSPTPSSVYSDHGSVSYEREYTYSDCSVQQPL